MEHKEGEGGRLYLSLCVTKGFRHQPDKSADAQQTEAEVHTYISIW